MRWTQREGWIAVDRGLQTFPVFARADGIKVYQTRRGLSMKGIQGWEAQLPGSKLPILTKMVRYGKGYESHRLKPRLWQTSEFAMDYIDSTYPLRRLP